MQSNKSKLFLGIVILLLVVWAALYFMNKKNEGAENPNISETDFDAFYQKFHSDAEFQLSRIDFPLQGMPGMADSLMMSKPFFWEKEDWKILHTIDWDTVTGYNRRFEDTGLDMINEFICTPDMFCIKRRLAKKEDGWHLIFYSDMNFTRFQ
ncbi:MAG: hypothetical protein ACPG5P_08365 [Saprospiraceae bacterium]